MSIFKQGCQKMGPFILGPSIKNIGSEIHTTMMKNTLSLKKGGLSY